MSTYYFLACDKCRERCDVASDAAGGLHGLGHSWALSQFVFRHRNCPTVDIRITNEYTDTHDIRTNYAEPFAADPDPWKEDEAERMRLLARAQDAEAEVRKLRDLYA